MLAIKKKKTENQPKYRVGWNYGVNDTLSAIANLFDTIEYAGYTVCDVDIEKDSVNGSWEYICKVIKKG